MATLKKRQEYMRQYYEKYKERLRVLALTNYYKNYNARLEYSKEYQRRKRYENNIKLNSSLSAVDPDYTGVLNSIKIEIYI